METKTVGKNATSFLITKLDPEKTYHVTLALVVNNQPGLKSQKLQIRPKLGILLNALSLSYQFRCNCCCFCFSSVQEFMGVIPSSASFRLHETME